MWEFTIEKYQNAELSSNAECRTVNSFGLLSFLMVMSIQLVEWIEQFFSHKTLRECKKISVKYNPIFPVCPISHRYNFSMATVTWSWSKQPTHATRSWSCCHYCSLCACNVHICRTPDYTDQPTHMRIGHHSQTRHSTLWLQSTVVGLLLQSPSLHFLQSDSSVIATIYSCTILHSTTTRPDYYYPSLPGARSKMGHMFSLFARTPKVSIVIPP